MHSSTMLNSAFSVLLCPVFGSRLVEVSEGSGTMELEHYQAGFKPLLDCVLLALIQTGFLEETGPAVRDKRSHVKPLP